MPVHGETKTNTNLQIVEKSIAGYVEKAITSVVELQH